MRTFWQHLGISRTSIIAMIALGMTACIFEFSTIVREAQSFVSIENYENSTTECRKIIQERPWYGKINHWFWIWLVLVPILIFSVTPKSSVWLHGGRTALSIIVCYALMNLAIHLQWDIRNAPFMADPFHPDPVNGWRMDCHNFSGDGFSYVIALLFAWLPASVYTGLCVLLWRFYHRRFSKKLTDNYKTDIMTLILLWGLKIYFILILLFILSIVINAIGYSMTGDILYNPKLLFLPYYLLIRPLNIPFEIFIY